LALERSSTGRACLNVTADERSLVGHWLDVRSPVARYVLRMEIRDAQPQERDALGALHRRSSYVWEEDRTRLEAHPDALGVPAAAIAERRVRVAVGSGGAILGFAVVAGGENGVSVLDDLFVEPDFMRQGIGRALVEDAAARARAGGASQMTVVAHERNFAFYESVGFVRSHATSTRFGPATTMRRGLTTRRP
jgi:GNAT superfamily N-acetyltransferase